MHLSRMGLAASLSLAALFTPCAWLPAQEARVLQVVEDYEKVSERQIRPITHWRWTAEQKQEVATYAGTTLTSGPDTRGKALRIQISRPLPQTLPYFPFWDTPLDYFHPETETVRLRVKVVSGTFRISAGGPTTYFAVSDVRARPVELRPGPWQTVELSLIKDLERNYRRDVFSRHSPVIYYTRWVQEPMRLLISADSQGELLVDDVELITRGVGRPFPGVPPGRVTTLAVANPASRFTFATDDREFDLSHQPGGKPVRKPAILEASTTAPATWTARQLGLEEMSFFGLKAKCPPEANAVRLKLRMDHATGASPLALDILTLVAEKSTFPWEKTAPAAAASVTNGQVKGFDYCLSPGRTKGIPWGFYHARRAVPQGQWTELVIPFTDFVCAYGQHSLLDRHRLQQVLRPEEVVAVAMVSPWRQNRAETLFSIESIEFVRIEGPAATGTSYPQVPDISRVKLEKIPGVAGQGQDARQVPAP